jgi:hypothetical protein
MKIILLCLIFASYLTTAGAQDSAMPDFTIKKSEIEKSLKHLLDQGQISESDYKKAMLQLGKMDDGQLNELKDKALGVVKEDPKKAKKMIEKTIDGKQVPTTTTPSAPAKK